MSRPEVLAAEVPIRWKSAALAAACLVFLMLPIAGCGPASRHSILSALFDGVPTPRPTPPPGPLAGLGTGTDVASARPGASRHAPYAANDCDACHRRAAGNALLAPKNELCFRCHEFKLDRKYVHGPLASGGCLVCHDPHVSRYPRLLVSESATFCLDCHDRGSVEKVGAHQGITEQCTTCHDAHMSDKEYLLK